MTTAPLTPNQAYEIFVGCTVSEFIDGQSVDDAIEQLMAEKLVGIRYQRHHPPENLADLIREYVESALAD